ncbi:MAG: helix-turn-helix transcriptional regulator [Ruminococcus sp.]|nr:helix-turn-helix transcriptional regulator [Ruminococcus sp.]
MFDKRLEDLRRERGYTVKKMASELNLAYTTYNNYEKNTREPDSDTLKKIACYFDVSIDYLLGNQQNINAEKIPIEFQVMYNKFKALDSHGKKMIQFILEEEYSRCIELYLKKNKSNSENIEIKNDICDVSSNNEALLECSDNCEVVEISDKI